MKKFFSAILALCLLISQVIIPLNVIAVEESVAYEDTTLGGYYKFTFTKDNLYNYAAGVKETYKNSEFTPLLARNNSTTSVGYKQVVDSVTGAKYDTLQIVNGDMVNFTPVTKDGQPYEITPGYDYRIKINMFNPISNSWVHGFICVGQENPVWANQIEINEGVYNYSNYPYAVGASLSNQGGMGWHYLLKDGTYGKTSKLGNYNSGACLHNTDSRFEITCSHTKHQNVSPYISKEQNFSIPVEYFDYDDDNMTYSATNEVYSLSDGNYTPTGTTVKTNNYLTFYLGGGNVSSYAKSNVPLYGNATYDDLYDQSGKAKNNYTVWQIESIEIWETQKGKVEVHVGDEFSSHIGNSGEAFDLSQINIPDDKYCIGWFTDKNFTTPLTDSPVFDENKTLTLYALLGDATDNATFYLDKNNRADLNPIKSVSDGTLKTVTLTEDGWAHKSFTDEGVVLGKSPRSNAYKWDPSKATTSSKHTQVASINDYVAIAADNPVGEQINGGWGCYSNYVLRDENGNAACAQENSKYAVLVKYKKLSDGPQSLAVGIGRKASRITAGANDLSSHAYNSYSSAYLELQNTPVTEEIATHTFFVNVGEFADGDVPVISIHNGAGGFLVERVAADKNGVKSYVCKADGLTYYPYKIVSYAQILITEVQVIKIDDDKIAVSYNNYKKGEGFSTVLTEDLPGAEISYSTNCVDENWYDSADARGTAYNAVPYENTALYSGEYYIAHDYENNPSSPIFGDGVTLSSATTQKSLKDVFALKYTSSVPVSFSDSQVFRLGELQDGHTYKVSMSFKAEKLSTDLKIGFATASNTGAADNKNLMLTKTISKRGLILNKWSTLTFYFTADPIGEVMDLEECGMEYLLSKGNSTLYLYLGQEVSGDNTAYLTTFKIVDLGEVITSGGTSVLTDKAAQSAGQQAIRYYFNYATQTGSDITLDGVSLKIVERGFIYTDGFTKHGEKENERVFATNPAMLKKSKTKKFDECWAYEDGVLTFSTYVNDFKINNDDRKVQIKGYLLVEDAKGNQFYIHSPTINRSVYGAQNPNNGHRLIWAEEFNVNDVSELEHFTQKYDTMASTDSNLKTSTSADNYFVDTKTGELVLRITSDGNRNYTTPKSVTTRDGMSFRYGYLEMRAKVPYQSCVWPSFWLQPDKSSWNKTKYTGEIDIFEIMGNKTRADLALHKWHGGGSCSIGSGKLHFLDGYNKTSYTFSSNREAIQYHTYGFEWTPEYMAFYVDGNIYCKIDITNETGDYCTSTHPGMECFHNFYYICLNNWVFTDQQSGWVPASNRAENVADFGTVDYKIDYIRLYQNRNDGLYIY